MGQKNSRGHQISLDEYSLNEVSVRLVLHEGPALYSDSKIRNPEDGVNVMKDMLKELNREMVCAVNLDSQGRPINYSVVSMGDIASSVVPVRQVFLTALMSNASAVLLAHNHPSGSTCPSREDREVTKRVVAAGEVLGVSVLDHIIVGAYSGDIYSFKTNEPDLFCMSADRANKITADIVADASVSVEEEEELEM